MTQHNQPQLGMGALITALGGPEPVEFQVLVVLEDEKLIVLEHHGCYYVKVPVDWVTGEEFEIFSYLMFWFAGEIPLNMQRYIAMPPTSREEWERHLDPNTIWEPCE